ncbi:ATP-dependent DNA helicase RecG [Dethiosulfatibacter aminovorans DSM 17477]|uniref:ATP-dependent DNA helicase RecG n=1 Tax=Dethiosulfatibacter aminovorans DSM 17477 TaxID=1121476 RepID=A0A1M6IG46_9FIRM|nr:ATP-dependent DNA helicase RecG [Dethiosulfatibacter aminovorans DSM 17477]
MLLGVSDDGSIKGTDTSNVAKSRIQTSIKQIKPAVNVEIKVVDNVIVIDVKEGRDKPYACSKGFFLRMGANSQKLERDDIIDFFQSEGKIRFDELLRGNIDFDSVFDAEAYTKFLNIAGISNVIDKENVLVNLDCGIVDQRFIANNAGLLFFSKNPMDYIKHAYVVGALYKGVDKITVLDRKEMKGNIIDVIEESILFLRKHLNLRYEITDTRRKEILDVPEIALREAVINAVCHRDYFEKGAQVMIEIFDDRVVITNPGGLPKGLNKSNFGKISIARNPVIASLLQRSEYIEKMGTGIARMKNAMVEAKLPEPEFTTDGFFIVSFVRESFFNNVGETVGETVGEKFVINQLQKSILEQIKNNPKVTAEKIAGIIGVSSRTVERNIKLLKDNEYIVRVGADKGGYWEIIDNR